MSRYQATEAGIGRLCWPLSEKDPPGVAKYNFHVCDLLGVK
jgi:hypothetical protein